MEYNTSPPSAASAASHSNTTEAIADRYTDTLSFGEKRVATGVTVVLTLSVFLQAENRISRSIAPRVRTFRRTPPLILLVVIFRFLYLVRLIVFVYLSG